MIFFIRRVMYKAMDIHSQKEVIIIDPFWTQENIDDLRDKDRLDSLCCPGCKEPVRVKAGKKRRWHFAHKDLSDCSLRQESPEILEARGQLYIWLESKFADQVTVEKSIPDIPILFDCFVETDDRRGIGYLIFEKGMRNRDLLIDTLGTSDIQVVSIFLHKVLNIDREHSHAVHLTPSERDFSFTSEYNQIYSHNNNGLVYLDETKGKIVTLRGLRCVHQPQKYEFNMMLTNELSQMLVLKGTGELIHPGEYETFCAWEKQKKEEERIQEIARKKEQERQRLQEEQYRIYLKELERKAALHRSRNYEFLGHQLSREISIKKRNRHEEIKPKREDVFTMDQEYYTCGVCGKNTTDWVSLETKDNTCVCSTECLKLKHSMQRQ